MNAPANTSPAQSLPVYPADTFRVIEGANLGDGIGFSQELLLDDVYALAAGAQPELLAIRCTGPDTFEVGRSSGCGRAGAPLALDCCVTLMTADGSTTAALILVELSPDGDVADVYLAPLAALRNRTPYTLVGYDTRTAQTTFAELSCARFVRGTHLTMASGIQRKIEDIVPGDKLLTRDDGAQEVRWIGMATVRAVGEFAPVRIQAGALNNDHDLIVSPQHRLFIYQRTDRLGAGRSELLVKARHLVNGETITLQDGGFVDYFQLLFDRHHIVYAEGIAAESMLIDTMTKPAVPSEVASRLNDTPHGLGTGLRGLDVHQDLLKRPDAIDILRRASKR